MSPEHDITLRIDFSGTAHPEQREDIRRAFDVLLDSLFEHAADSGCLAFNVGGAAECRLSREWAAWHGRPTSAPVPPQEGD
jgi:hypothetical protein